MDFCSWCALSSCFIGSFAQHCTIPHTYLVVIPVTLILYINTIYTIKTATFCLFKIRKKLKFAINLWAKTTFWANRYTILLNKNIIWWFVDYLLFAAWLGYTFKWKKKSRFSTSISFEFFVLFGLPQQLQLLGTS